MEIHRSLHLKLEPPFSQSIVNEVYDTVVLELLRQKTETETVETAALGELVQRRLNGPMISATEMESRVAAMIERKRLVVRVDS
ncbi:hypothetical protein CDO26_20225 (plasmid) [Sinorhizobium meliloti]|nr:hypothetical protein CDO26_20225 [Sinorhizobium meliloti]MQW29623.1 hypothetical protein [Sinorhizobium meliloti]